MIVVLNRATGTDLPAVCPRHFKEFEASFRNKLGGGGVT